MIIAKGFADGERGEIAALYWQAFGPKLGRVLGPDRKALALIAPVLSPAHAYCARTPQGRLLGVAGFRSPDGALVDAGWPDMARAYGWTGALWRVAALALVGRDVDNARFLLDGIFVAATARGQGVGSRLIEALAGEARDRGYRAMRLDVIESNTRARALYERRGFEAVGVERVGALRRTLGFETAVTMVRWI